LMENEDIKIN